MLPLQAEFASTTLHVKGIIVVGKSCGAFLGHRPRDLGVNVCQRVKAKTPRVSNVIGAHLNLTLEKTCYC